MTGVNYLAITTTNKDIESSSVRIKALSEESLSQALSIILLD